jgi:acetyl esterase/lipase
MTLPVNRREIILGGTMTALSPSLLTAAPAPTDDIGGLPLWPKGAPGAERVSAQEVVLERAAPGLPRDRIVQHVRRPLLTLFPPRGEPNGITLLIIPGGAYVRVVIDKEGIESAEWFAAQGFHAALLRYRLPGDGWAAGADAPVHDAMRAVRLLRAQGAKRVGVLGFSAGGHVAARLITARPDYSAVDSADDATARPDFAALMYPVINMNSRDVHAASRDQILAAGVPEAELDRLTPATRVTPDTPPTLLMHAADDDAVPVGNSFALYEALRAAGIRSELHVFDRGGHGFGLRGTPGKTIAVWPTLVANWARSA